MNATKSSTHITGAGGSIEFKALPAMLVFGTGNSLREEWIRDPPVGNVLLGVISQFEENGELVTRDVLALYVRLQRERQHGRSQLQDEHGAYRHSGGP